MVLRQTETRASAGRCGLLRYSSSQQRARNTPARPLLRRDRGMGTGFAAGSMARSGPGLDRQLPVSAVLVCRTAERHG